MRVKVDESRTKKPSIPYGIGPSKPECGEAKWLQHRKKSIDLAGLENILLIRHVSQQIL